MPLSLSLPILGAALAATAPSLSAVRTSEAPQVDGKLDDAAWAKAVPTDAFTQRFPHQGAAPSERTTMRVLYDDTSVYVAFDCEQTRSPLVARLTRRDRPIEADRVSFAIDSRMDGTTAFDFAVNAAGVLYDTIRFNDTDLSPDWDENWEARTAQTATGWTAEFRIPLRILRFGEKPIQAWGFQARRYVSARQEESLWSFIPRETTKEVSAYGHLTDLAGLRQGGTVEVRPYVLGSIRRSDATSDALDSGTDLNGTLGVDLKWHPTQDLTLDVSVNPDFAQVEADQVILNLTPRYELLLPERRPFFLEGQDVFTTPFQLFYTRRIGRVAPSPSLRTGAPHDDKLAALPTPATLYGASKLIGRLAPKWSIGMVNTVAARNDVTVVERGGGRIRRLAEPLTGFQVLRLKRDVGDNGHIGLLATSTVRGEDASGYAPLEGTANVLCPSGDVMRRGERCFHNAHVGGIDARWRSANGNYLLSGQAIASTIHLGRPRTLADGTVIKSGDTDVGINVRAAKDGGKPFTAEVHYVGAGKRLDFNDLGYMYRQNAHVIDSFVMYRTLDPWWRTLTTEQYVGVSHRWNTDGLAVGRVVRAGAYWQFTNFWEGWVQVAFKPAFFDDREMGDGTALERAHRGVLNGYLGTDPRKAFRFEIDGESEVFAGGSFSKAEAILTVRTIPALDLQLLPQFLYSRGEPRFAAPGVNPGEYVFGKYDATNVGGTLRATYTFTPKLSLQTYAQVFLAAQHYQDFTRPTFTRSGPGVVVRRSDLVPTSAPAGNPDSIEAALNVNAVLRWEYRLGSTLFFVYTRTQSPNVMLTPGQSASLDFGALRRAPASDVFLVKLTYWWG